MASTDLVGVFEIHPMKCAIYLAGEKLVADVEIETQRATLDVKCVFPVDKCYLKEKLREMWTLQKLNVEIDNDILIFSEKAPEDPIAIFEAFGLPQPVAGSSTVVPQSSTPESELLVANSQKMSTMAYQKYVDIVQDAEDSIIAALECGGEIHVQLERPRFIFNKKKELQAMSQGSMHVKYTPEKALAAKLKVRENEEEAKADLLVQEEENKLACVTTEHATRTSNMLQLEKAKLDKMHQNKMLEEEKRLEEQEAERKKSLASMKTFLETVQANQHNSIEKEISRRKAELQKQESEYERAKQEMHNTTSEQLASERRRVEQMEEEARQKQSMLENHLNSATQIYNKGIQQIAAEKEAIARRREEEARIQREQQELIARQRQEQERIRRANEAARQARAAAMERQWRAQLLEEQRQKQAAASERARILREQQIQREAEANRIAREQERARARAQTYAPPPSQPKTICSLL